MSPSLRKLHAQAHQLLAFSVLNILLPKVLDKKLTEFFKGGLSRLDQALIQDLSASPQAPTHVYSFCMEVCNDITHCTLDCFQSGAHILLLSLISRKHLERRAVDQALDISQASGRRSTASGRSRNHLLEQ